MQFLIVAGAEKAGTTSLFSYLSAHPSTCPSRRKETDWFRGASTDASDYLRHFPDPAPGMSTYLEASPGYLAEAEVVAPRIAHVLPRARLVFVLRDPVDRLASSFRFYKSRLHVPDGMTLDEFVDLCFDFIDSGGAAPLAGIDPWHLSALQRGRYESQLAPFRRAHPEDRILMLDYGSLRDKPREVLGRIARFAGLDARFYDSFVFERENVSFLARRVWLQRFAVAVNDGLEGLWRRHPRLKRSLLATYKRINERPMEADPLSPRNRQRLQLFYQPTYSALPALLGAGNPR